jgi:hypothetical protein
MYSKAKSISWDSPFKSRNSRTLFTVYFDLSDFIKKICTEMQKDTFHGTFHLGKTTFQKNRSQQDYEYAKSQKDRVYSTSTTYAIYITFVFNIWELHQSMLQK